MPEQYLNYLEACNEILKIKKEGGLILGIERLVIQENGDLFADIGGIADIEDMDPDGAYESAIYFLSEYGSDKNERFIITVE